MYCYIANRIAFAVPTLLFVLVLNFLLVNSVPGDVAYALGGENATPEYLEYIRERYGLNEPLWTRFVLYIGALLQGDLGYSFTYHAPVTSLIATTIPATLALALTGMILAMVLGVLAGALSARFYGSISDIVLNIFALTASSLPIFWLGLVLILVFSVFFGGLLPSSGMHSLPRPSGFAYVLDVARHMVLPTIALTLYNFPTYFRLTRRAVIDVLNEDFIATARAVGLSERRIFFRHCLRNALLPNITIAGLMIGALFSGAVLTEAVFAWPGMGNLMYGAVLQRDLPLVMGIFTVSAISVIVVTLLTDLAYGLADPRVRHAN